MAMGACICEGSEKWEKYIIFIICENSVAATGIAPSFQCPHSSLVQTIYFCRNNAPSDVMATGSRCYLRVPPGRCGWGPGSAAWCWWWEPGTGAGPPTGPGGSLTDPGGPRWCSPGACRPPHAPPAPPAGCLTGPPLGNRWHYRHDSEPIGRGNDSHLVKLFSILVSGPGDKWPRWLLFCHCTLLPATSDLFFCFWGTCWFMCRKSMHKV